MYYFTCNLFKDLISRMSSCLKEQIFQGLLGMQRERFLNMTKYGKHLEAYKTYLRKMLWLFGAERKKVEVLVKEVVDFEIQLAKVTSHLVNYLMIFYGDKWPIDKSGKSTIHASLLL